MNGATLHIYSQPYEHADAVIAGNKEGLAVLMAALKTALELGNTTSPVVFASDGEGYEIKIKVLPDKSIEIRQGRAFHDPEWAKNPPHYCCYDGSRYLAAGFIEGKSDGS